MNKKETIFNIGGISKTSKMPCNSFNLSAYFCKVGNKLVTIKDSVCNGCYALKGRYRMNKKNGVKSHFRKMNKFNNTQLWIDSFVNFFHNHYKTTSKIDSRYFRWFDSGDLQSYRMLLAIVEICRKTPNINHWLPTREYTLIKKYIKEYKQFPENLCVRVSAPMIDSVITSYNNTSSVLKDGRIKKTDVICNASQQNNECKDCRLCWNTSIKNITYKYH